MEVIQEIFERGWEQLTGRDSGPLHLRFVIQPLIAALLAIRAGLRDARTGQPPIGWALLHLPSERRRLIRSGWKDISAPFIIAIVLDGIYQVIVFHAFYIFQALIIAFVLAVIPYALLRGATNRLTRRHVATLGVRENGARDDSPATPGRNLEEATTVSDHREAEVPQLAAADRLALERTRIAYNSSVQTGVRTGTTLITFGFSVYKFFQLEATEAPPSGNLVGTREFAVILIVIGLLSIVLGTLEHRRDLRQIRTQYRDMPRSSAGLIAALVSLLGILALVAVLFSQ